MPAAATDRIALGSYTCDVRAGTVSLSASLRQIAGLGDTDTLPLDQFLAHVHPADRAAVAATTHAGASTAPRALLCRLIRPGGECRWTVLRPTTTRGDSGEVERIVGLVIDATASYDAYRSVAATASDPAAFEAAVRDAPIALAVCDATGVRSVNEAFTQLTGFTRDDLDGRPLTSGLWGPLHLDQVLARLGRREPVDDRVVRLRRSNDRAISVLFAASPVEDGARPGALLALVDASVRFDADGGTALLQDQLRDLADSAAEGIAFTENGVILDCNDRFADSLGYTVEELRGRSMADLVDPAMADDVRTRIAADAVSPYVCRLRHRDGRILPFEVGARIVRRGNRKIRVKSVRDLSERERADRAMQALRQSREQFRQLAEAHGEGVVLLEDHRIIDANTRFAALAGADRAEIVGRLWSDVSALEPARAIAALDAAEESYVSVLLRRDGTTCPVEIAPRTIRGEGDHVYRIVTVRDVTRRERVEQLRRALVAGTAGVTGVDFFPAVVRHLAAALQVKHAFVAECAGTPPSRVVSVSVWHGDAPGAPFDRPLAGTPCDLVMQVGVQCFTRDVAALFPSDRHLAGLGAVGYFGAPLLDGGGKPVGVLAVVDDRPIERTDAAEDILTTFAARASVELQRVRGEEAIRHLNADLERRIAERTADLQAANHELEAFSYSVSHDLRAPLRQIEGFARLLLAPDGPALGADVREHVDEIEHAVRRMTALIDTLLDFSRLARAALRAEPVSIAELARAAAAEIARDTSGRTVRWSIDAIPPVWGDPILLRQVVVNLLTNAAKYSRTRDVATIHVGTAADPRPGEVVWFVRDNGVGFDMKYAGKLFGVFQRLHPSSRFEGTGIGLANVARIVTRHGGRVWAEATVDQGATFFVGLPAVPDGGAV